VQPIEENMQPFQRREWTSRSLGTRLGHSIFYGLIRFGGRRSAYFALYFVVFYYMLFRPSIRRRTKYYLHRRFQDRKLLARFVDSYRMSFELGKILIDRATLGILGSEKMKVTLYGRKKLLELLDRRCGFVLLMSHVGSWQVVLSALSFMDIPVNLLLEREQGNIDRHYFEYTGTKSPYRIIDPGGYLGGTLEMLEVLKKGQVLCVMGDRVSGSQKSFVNVEFLGEEASFPYSAFKLASAAKVPIVVFFSYKNGPDSYALKISKIIRVPKNLGRSGKYFLPYVSQYIEALESYVQIHPYQFFNFYNMWEKKKDEYKRQT
jgi:predicted LPLAT superfamily acyltransferase